MMFTDVPQDYGHNMPTTRKNNVTLPPMTVRLVDADDWKGLYVNGNLKYEGHSIPDFVWVEVLRGDQIFLDEYEGGMDTLMNTGRFPERFSDFKEEYGI